MPEAAEVMVFNLSGRTRDAQERSLKERLAAFVRADAPKVQHSTAAGAKSEDPGSENPGPVAELNEHSEPIARMLETEILAALPPDPGLSVQVELRFRGGSIVLIGTAAILSWTGSIVLEAIRDEIAELIRIAAQRAIGAAMAQWAPGAGAMQCMVTPRRSSAVANRPEASTPASGQALTSMFRGLSWRNALTGFLTLAVLVLLIDRFFDVSLRTVQTPTVLAPAAQTSQAAAQPAGTKP
jgi:hypothetical protein